MHESKSYITIIMIILSIAHCPTFRIRHLQPNVRNLEMKTAVFKWIPSVSNRIHNDGSMIIQD